MPPTRPDAHRVALLLFTAGWGANHFAALLVVYRKELGFSPAALGVLFGAYALGLVPGLVFAGRASDTYGRRALVLPASAAAIAASSVLAFGNRGFAVLLAGRLLFGLAMGSIMSPGSVWVQELSGAALGPRRATLALSAGFGLGPLVSGAIAEFAPAPMIAPYALHAALMALGLVGVRSVPETATRSRSSTPRPALGRREMAALARLVPVAPWAFGFPSVSVAILPGIMRPLVPRPVLYSAVVIATTLLTGVVVQPLTARLGPRGDRLALAAGAAAELLAAYAVVVRAPALAFPVAVVAGGAYGIVMTTGLREIVDRVPKETRGTAVGIYYVMTYVGFALPLLHAVVAERLGDIRTLAVTAAAALASLGVRSLVGAGRRP